MPNISGAGGASVIEGALGEDSDSDLELDLEDYDPPSQVDASLETLSDQPRVKFNTLIHIDAIRERNKPTEAVKAPEKSSFFLGLPEEATAEEELKPMADLQPVNAQFESEFTHLLRTDPPKMVQALAKMGPAATDLELRSLDVREPYDEVVAFIDAVSGELEASRNFELVQAWMNMLLRIHGDIFAKPSAELAASFAKYQELQMQEIARLQDHTRFCAGVMTYLRGL